MKKIFVVKQGGIGDVIIATPILAELKKLYPDSYLTLMVFPNAVDLVAGLPFIDEVYPKYSVIRVGKNNRYCHPNKEVLKNLEDSKIYRTDKDGSIMFKIKNNKLKIETCSP